MPSEADMVVDVDDLAPPAKARSPSEYPQRGSEVADPVPGDGGGAPVIRRVAHDTHGRSGL